MVWWFLQSKVWIFLVHKLIGGNVLRNPPIKSLNICCSQIDWRKCSDDSSNQQFEYLSCTNWLEEMSWWFLQSKIWVFWCTNWLEEMFCEILRSKNCTNWLEEMFWEILWARIWIFFVEIDWRRWSDDSSNQKFAYLWCTNWLEELTALLPISPRTLCSATLITPMLKATVTTVLISTGTITNASVFSLPVAADALALRQPGIATKTNTFRPTDVTDKAHARLRSRQMSMMPSDDAHGDYK